jgi:uncharacterized repeat protein (TIGR03803 family)
MYGTTYLGGASNLGTVFELAHGSGTITTLASFNGTNGAEPIGGLIMDGSGNLYGTTSGVHYRTFNSGTVFEVAHGSGAITTLATFNGTNGANPCDALIMDSSGNLYGTTKGGGFHFAGTVFELAHGSHTITTLASFNGGGNGANPYAGLIMDSGGNFYGTTSTWGAYQRGTVFELAHGSHTITTLASFNGTNGANPYGGLIMDSSGNLYGTTYSGGSSSDGTVFELAQGSGTISTLAAFNGTNGAGPEGGLIVDSGGNLYGTTAGGGASSNGTVFELTGGGAPTSLQIAGFPSSAGTGASQTFSVTVPNSVGTTDTTYVGTVDFASTDSTANLPAKDATADNRTPTFSGFVLQKKGKPLIMARDMLFSPIAGSISADVS